VNLLNISLIALFLIGGIYGILSILAGIFQLKQKKINKWANLLMIIGGILVLISLIPNINLGIYVLITGLISIHVSAINNGYKMYGRINPKHHVIRLCISIALIICLWA
jgi:uncharacterized membrane protein